MLCIFFFSSILMNYHLKMTVKVHIIYDMSIFSKFIQIQIACQLEGGLQ